jgi:hypothetical protein
MAILVEDVVASNLGINICNFVVSTGGSYTLTKNKDTGFYSVQYRMFYYINEQSYRAKGMPIQESYGCLDNIDINANTWELIFANIASLFTTSTKLDP